MNSNNIREKFLKFFEDRGHTRVPSSSLVPTDPSVLFTTAGMQQFKPYYTGESSPYGDMVTSVQKCVRTKDIEEVGDAEHLTFFEMLGNFAFNNAVSKEQAIKWAHEFITSEMGLTIDYVTIFEGDDQTPRDDESERIWQSIDSSIEIREEPRSEVFWGPTGDEGPCGPTTEIYIGGVEIWNIVFNEYYCNSDGSYDKLENFGIDTGMGLERLAVAAQQKGHVYDTDLFQPMIELLPNDNERSARILADHAKAARFMVYDGITPSNTGSGYILRRLIRRAIMHTQRLGLEVKEIGLGDALEQIYPDLADKSQEIKDVLQTEREKFLKTLEKGMKEFEKGERDAFKLFSTYGFPLEMTQELAQEKGETLDIEEFQKKMSEHQELSKTASAGTFKGGLADDSSEVTKLHTAHHLLLAALQQTLGPDVKQRGSNINADRLRMDFSFDRKLTGEEKQQVEDQVNSWIDEGLEVVQKEMPRQEAEELGAEMEFGIKYPDMVSVYFVGDISKEFCGGPHVGNTSELGKFKIKKEESSSAGVRRIKAVLE